MNRLEATQAFNNADEVWSAELVRQFGKRSACNARYQPRGRGKPGSALRAKYEAREEARKAFCKAWDCKA